MSNFPADPVTELDTFFDNRNNTNAPKPPPPGFVDKREFHQQTFGGFGNVPAGNMGAGAQKGGDMDGIAKLLQNPNVQQLQAAAAQVFQGQSFAAVRERWQHHFGSNLRPWRDFALPLAKPTDSAAAFSHIKRNISYFQTNYTLLFVLYFILNVLCTPSSIFTVMFIGGMWALFLKKNEDPSWVTQVAGVTVEASARYMLMVAMSVLIIFFMCGSLIFSSCMVFGFCAVAHATLHTPPTLDDEEFGGVNVVGVPNV